MPPKLELPHDDILYLYFLAACSISLFSSDVSAYTFLPKLIPFSINSFFAKINCFHNLIF